MDFWASKTKQWVSDWPVARVFSKASVLKLLFLFPCLWLFSFVPRPTEQELRWHCSWSKDLHSAVNFLSPQPSCNLSALGLSGTPAFYTIVAILKVEENIFKLKLQYKLRMFSKTSFTLHVWKMTLKLARQSPSVWRIFCKYRSFSTVSSVSKNTDKYLWLLLLFLAFACYIW